MLKHLRNKTNQIKALCTIMIFAMGVGFTSLAQAQVELGVHGGLHYGGVDLQELTATNPLANQESKMSWELGADGLYRLPTHDKFAIGLRWQYGWLPEADYASTTAGAAAAGTPPQAPAEQQAPPAEQQLRAQEAEAEVPASQEAVSEEQPSTQLGKYEYSYHRFALLLNYRFLNEAEGFFAGVVAAVDVWKQLRLGVNVFSPGLGLNNKLWLWESITGQIGLEAGYKVNANLLVRAELGWNHLPINKWERAADDRDQNPQFNENSKADFSGFYFKAGIGYFFG